MSHRKQPRGWTDDLERVAVTHSDRSREEDRPQAEAISVASVWQMESLDSADAALSGESGAYAYRRDGHPNERVLATKLAQLHGADQAMITAQGMSAISAVAWSVLEPGKSAWIGNELYGKSSQLFSKDMQRWGVETRVFDPASAHEVRELANNNADLVLVETISNPRLRVPDLAAVSEATRAAGGLLVVDNTFATHLICQPLTLGADIVVESLSKQINGHSDSMLGLVCGSDGELMANIRDAVSTFGLASSPLDCYLTHRGLRSLALRVERACANALALAEALSELSSIQSVDYPGLADHPQHALAADQLRGGFGWMLSFRTDVGRAGVMKLFEALRPDIPFAPSLGDVNTTVSHPASTSHRSLSEAESGRLGITDGTVRVSCGIEPSDWLVGRISSAIRQMLA